LGSFSFAHSINRTLILPPWVEYQYAKPTSIQIPFDTYFRVENLNEYHRVITMETFMKHIAPTLWPVDKRYVFCWSARQGKNENDCNAKEGNPFGPFWDNFNIDFVGSQFYGDGLTYDSGHQWNIKFPPDRYPVLAFAGAPASFPVREKDKHLHKHLVWSSTIEKKAKNFVKTVLPPGPFIGLHLRNDLDWDNVCKHVQESRQLFASPQCLGYNNEKGKLTMEICKPSVETIIKQTKAAVKKFNAKSVFVGADKNHLIHEINKALQKLGVKAYKREPDEPHVTLAILALSEHYIGNCVSTFSAFAKRERDEKNLSSSFWGVPYSTTTSNGIDRADNQNKNHEL